MKIGIVGVGMVGSALSYGFKRIGHEVLEHDLKLGTRLESVLEAEIVYVCVPTPQASDGSCDVAWVETVIRGLSNLGYSKLVVIKSTVPPGTTDRLSRENKSLGLAFCPEFLRERASFSDFVENQTVCVAGVYADQGYQLIVESHGSLPKSWARVTPLEAELTKYYANVFNALRVVFANQFYDVCKTAGADYTAIKNAVVKRGNIGDFYLDCNEQLRGFGGSCLPKDTAAFAAYVEKLGVQAPLFKQIVDINAGIK